MSLFHIGTPVEHAYYRKMSVPELGNAMMLNQAQSNSLVVEACKRWIKAESNCRRFECEADRLKEQVSEAKEVSKASQASAAAAYKARDKALHDLEGLKLKFGVLEKKLSEVEEKNKAEQKEMQSTYDQLLADHVRLVNGVAWVVKLVHQSPELERVVADLMNSVNAVGVHDGIKQGFQAAKSSARSVEEVLGYDEGAKNTLDVTIKPFDNFHVLVLDKISELVNEPLLVIKEKSKLPIVKED
ncbi:hypothetical protein Hdeb2414_s0017g00508791 [Helianthus debilis subsp. tardiflorus]